MSQSVIKLTLDMPISANRYWRHNKGRIHRSDEAESYIQKVGCLCATAGIQPLDGDVRVTLRFYRKAKKGDLDNFFKILGDALQGYCYHNDSQIAEIHATSHDTDPHCPRVEVTIENIGATP